jgi:hypothetical protein
VQVTDAELLDHLDAERMKGFGAAMRVTTMTFHVPAHMTFREYVTVQIGYIRASERRFYEKMTEQLRGPAAPSSDSPTPTGGTT